MELLDALCLWSPTVYMYHVGQSPVRNLECTNVDRPGRSRSGRQTARQQRAFIVSCSHSLLPPNGASAPYASDDTRAPCPTNAEQKSRPSAQSSRRCAKPGPTARRQTQSVARPRCVAASAPREVRDTERARQTAGPSTARRDVDDLVTSLLGTNIGRSADSANDSPASSMPGTPALGQTSSPAIAGPSALSLSLSGRMSRQSDGASDRVSLGTTFVQSANGGTDNVIERYVSPRTVCARGVSYGQRPRVMTPRMVPDLIDVEQELFELPQKVCGAGHDVWRAHCSSCAVRLCRSG